MGGCQWQAAPLSGGPGDTGGKGQSPLPGGAFLV